MVTASGGQETSPAQMFTIVIPPNQFQDVVGQANNTGNFTGLFYDQNETIPNSSGYVSVTLTNDGSFFVNLVSVGNTNTGSGQFSISTGNSVVGVTNSGIQTYSLNLTIDPGLGTIAGYVTNVVSSWEPATAGGGVPVLTYLATNPIVTPGQYTFTLPGFDDLAEGPIGDSVFTVGIDSYGTATLVGSLADNSSATQVASLSALGLCPVYIPLYTNATTPGLLIGWLTFTNDLAESMSLTTNSALIWFNPATDTPNLYPLGFTNQAVAFGSTYVNSGNNLLGSASATGNGYVVLSGGDLGADPVVKKVIISDNVITAFALKDRPNLSLIIDQSAGTISGSYLEANGTTVNTIQGVILQNSAYASGYFIGAKSNGEGSTTNECGLFQLYGN
jgi:hypothetical protein